MCCRVCCWRQTVRFIAAAFVTVLALLTCQPATATLVGAEQSILTGFYTALGGASWTNNTGWNPGSTDPCTGGWAGVLCDASSTHVTSLILTNNGLAGTIPSALTSLSQLQVRAACRGT